MTTEAGASAVRKLIEEHADVVVENFRPGVVDRWGLSAEACRATRPDLVYLSMPGFASADAALAQTPAWEPLILAVAGVFRDMGVNRQLMGVPASYSPLPLASAYGSVVGALAVVAALYRRAKGAARLGAAGGGRESAGPGETIEVPLASALLDTLVHNSMEFDCPERYLSPRQRRANTMPAGGSDPLDYEDVQELMDPFYNHYRCSDGRPFYLVAPAHLRHQQHALEVLGLMEEVRALGVPTAEPYVSGRVPGAMVHGLGAGQVGDEWAPTLQRLMRRAFLRRTAFEWEALMGAAGVPGAAHRTTTEWLCSSHAREAGLSVVDEGGSVRPGPLAWVFEEMNLAEDAEAGPLDQPSAASEEQQEASDSSVPVESTAFLDGVRVLDLANVIAGPTIGTMLARFGAEVVKVDAPSPMYSPEITVLYGMAANAGKRSALIDLKDGGAEEDDGASGKAALAALVARSDLVVVNCTTECLDRLGLSPAALRRINPRAILVRFDAWGGPKEGCGPRAQHLGYDDNVQAAMGIMARFGGGLGRIEEHAHVGTIDVIAGVGGALAAAAALLHRERGLHRRGGGTIVARASLASLGQVLQFPFCCGSVKQLEEEAAVSATAAGQDCRGEHSMLRCYQAGDGEWLMLAASMSCLSSGAIHKVAGADPALAQAVAIAQQAETTDPARALAAGSDAWELDAHLAALLEQVFFLEGTSAEGWTSKLLGAGVPAACLRSIAEVRDASLRKEVRLIDGPTFQFVTDPSHPLGGPVTMFAPCAIRPRRAAMKVPLSPAPRYGQHTEEILREAGVDPLPLLSRGAAATQWSEEYLPGFSGKGQQEKGEDTDELELVLTLPDRLAKKQQQCPICFETVIKAMELSCGHVLCNGCACKCNAAGQKRCPVCRHPHLLDPAHLASRSTEWRQGYGGWRAGKTAGAKGELASIGKPPRAALLCGGEDFLSESAGILLSVDQALLPDERKEAIKKMGSDLP